MCLTTLRASPLAPPLAHGSYILRHSQHFAVDGETLHSPLERKLAREDSTNDELVIVGARANRHCTHSSHDFDCVRDTSTRSRYCSPARQLCNARARFRHSCARIRNTASSGGLPHCINFETVARRFFRYTLESAPAARFEPAGAYSSTRFCTARCFNLRGTYAQDVAYDAHHTPA